MNAEVDRQFAMLRSPLVLDDVREDFDIVLESRLLLVQIGKSFGNSLGVVLNLRMKAGLGLMNKMAMMGALDTTFQSESDKQAHRDRKEMQEKVADAVHRRVRRMNVEHKKTSSEEMETSLTNGLEPFGNTNISFPQIPQIARISTAKNHEKTLDPRGLRSTIAFTGGEIL
jgi:hypothetical protein